MKVCSLFSVIGGFDQGFIDADFEIVWANDIDKYAVETYKANYATPIVCKDLNEVDLDDIPNFDVLIGGFPCQPFSMMGSQKGFDDARGTCFFRIAELIDNKIKKGHAPKAIVLENVRAIRKHDNGKTFATIQRILEEMGYSVFSNILNSADYGVPQVRNRLFIVCFLNNEIEFQYPQKQPLLITMHDVLEREVDLKYYLSDRVKPTILSSGTGGYVAKSEINQSPARPLCATMGKMHRACQDNYYSDDYIVGNGDTNSIRKLTPRECARLQGFDDDFVIAVSNGQAYKQFGNAVTVNVARAIAKQIRSVLENAGEWEP